MCGSGLRLSPPVVSLCGVFDGAVVSVAMRSWICAGATPMASTDKASAAIMTFIGMSSCFWPKKPDILCIRKRGGNRLVAESAKATAERNLGVWLGVTRLRALARLLSFDVAVARWRIRLERCDETARGLGDFLDRP